MWRLAVLALALYGSAAHAQFEDSPWLNWVANNSPHGFDITPDGTIWINLSEPGKRDDYAVRAQDLQEARQSKDRMPSFWVRGYHKKNPDVRHRESKARLTLDCARETLSTSLIAYYASEGRFLYQTGYVAPSYIIPGTYGAEYYRLFCLASDAQ
jgi:hypothetical protein